MSKTIILLTFTTLLSYSTVFSQKNTNADGVDDLVNSMIHLENWVTNKISNHSNTESLNTKKEKHTTLTASNVERASEKHNKIRAKWKKFTNKEGAFSVNFPEEPTDISHDAPNPLDEDGEPYHLKIITAKDEKNNAIYLVRYNDMPNGYYLNDREAGFSSIQDNLEGKAVMIGEPKEIKLNDIEGREIEIMIQGKFHAFIRMYIRGNRIYVLMAQNLNPNERVSQDNEFFKTFKFENYNFIQPTTYQPSSEDFEVSFFGNVKVTKDTVGYESTTIKNTTNYYSVNPSSGGLYQINHGELQKYNQIKALKDFYDEHIQLYMEWNDTITSKKDIKVGGIEGISFMIEDKDMKTPERHQIWLDNSRLFVMTAYLSIEELKDPISDAIFNSFKYDSSKDEPFDRLSSKAEVLLKDLHSQDTLIVQSAMGAFGYYKFEKADLTKLYQSLEDSYIDSTYTQGIREIIIANLTLYHDETTIPKLKNLYLKTFKDNEELKSAIVATIPSIEEENNLEVYKELMTQSPPTSSEDYSWEILSPFRDSIPFAVENYKLLTSLMDHEIYRNSILNISTNLIKEQSDKKSLVIEEQTNLLKYAKTDLDLYVKSIKDTLVDQFKYSSSTQAYLSLFNETAINSPITDDFTNKIIGLKENDWHKNQAVTARIRSKQNLDKLMVNRLMDSLYYRFEIMEAFHDTDQFQEVPEKYKQNESFAELSLHFNLYEEDYEPESMQIMGEIEKDGLKYYAYKIKYDEGEEALTSYIATVGPVKNVASMKELDLYGVHTAWDQLDYANWESQAEALIPESEESQN